MFRVAITGLFGGVLAALLASDGRASLHHPEDTTSMIPVGDDGAPEALPFDEFARRRLILRNVGNSDWPLVSSDPLTKKPVIDPKTGQPRPTERGEVDARIKKAQKKRPEVRTPEESVALAIDLLRFGRPDEAESVLRGHRRGFLPNVTLAHVAVAQGQWARAFDFLDIANSERPPASIPGTSPKKLAWQLKLNKGALLTLVKLRWNEAKGAKPPPETELPDQIWPVNFVNDAGVYEPGALAAAEKAKLPGGDFPEATATVQQLVLWFPYDVRLYWLLAELYAAQKEFKTAQKIMDECVDSGHYSNRKVLMQHREAVKKAAGVEPPPEPDPEPAVPFTMTAVWWYFGGVGAIALFALVRALLKREKGGGDDCGPVG